MTPIESKLVAAGIIVGLIVVTWLLHKWGVL